MGINNPPAKKENDKKDINQNDCKKNKEKEISSSFKINNSTSSSHRQTLLQNKRKEPETETKISQNYNNTKLSENKNEVADLNNSEDNNSIEIFNFPIQISFSQIDKEKEKLKNIIKKSQKRLNELEKIEKYKNELKAQINNKLSIEQENNENNIRKTVKKVISSYYKENEESLESFFKGLDKNGRNYIKEEINDLVNDYPKSYLKTQFLSNSNNNLNIGEQIIDLDENMNETMNHSAKNINKSKNVQSNESKNTKKQKNQIDLNYQKIIKSNKIDNYKNKESNNNPNNENSIDNALFKNQKKNEFNNYSFKCLTNNLNFEILKGTKEGMFSLELENNGSNPWPKNKTFLEFDDSKENINIQKIALEPLNPGFKTKVIVILNNLDKINLGQYYICLVFKVDGKEYGKTLLVNIEVTENTNKNKHKTIIKALRTEYDFSNTMFSNTMIGNALEEFKTFEGAVNKILEEKN